MSDQPSVTFDLAHDYLEVARAATAVSGPPGERLLGRHGHAGVQNAIFCVNSMAILYSYLAVEACVAQVLGGSTADAGSSSSLEERIRRACELRGVVDLEAAEPELWLRVRVLIRDAATLLLGPPDLEVRQAGIAELMTREEPLPYALVAQELIALLTRGSGGSPPAWLERNTLLDFKALLVE
jgi:hypothetical protein